VEAFPIGTAFLSQSRFLSITPSALVAIKISFGGTLGRALYQELKARHHEAIKSYGSS
jgi:hypothetical protein